MVNIVDSQLSILSVSENEIATILDKHLDDVTVTTNPESHSKYDCIVLDCTQHSLSSISEYDSKYESSNIISLIESLEDTEQAIQNGATDVMLKSSCLENEKLFCKRIDNYCGQVHDSFRSSYYDLINESDEIHLYELDREGKFVYLSDKLADSLGYNVTDLVGTHLSEFMSDNQFEQGTERLFNLLDRPDKRWETQEIPLVDSEGKSRWLKNHFTPLTNDGEFVGSIGLVHEITAEVERRSELRLYKEMVESAPDAIYYVDELGKVQYLNQAGLEFLDEDLDSIKGTYFGEYVTEKSEQALYEAVRTLLSNNNSQQEVLVETDWFNDEGELVPFEQHLSLFRSGSREFEGSVGLVREITERKEREQRLKVINRIFRHNVRNDFSAIRAHTEVLEELLSESERKHTDAIMERTTELIELSEKARKAGRILDERPTRQEISVNRAIDGALSKLEHGSAELRVNIDDAYSVYAIPGIEFAIYNLLENAIRHNSTDGLEVEITVTSDGGTICIDIADNGSGIPDHERKVLEREFENPLEHGSGIGLWVVHWIVQRSRGELYFGESEYGGALVTMELSEYN